MTRTVRSAIFAVIRAIAIVGLLAATLFPLIWIVSTAFKRNGEALSSTPSLFPHTPTLENFAAMVGPGGAGTFFTNSLVATAVSTVLTLVLAIPAAYALGIHRFPRDAGRPLSLGFLLLRFLPPFAVVIPLFLILRNAGLIDTVAALVIVYTAFHLPLAVWIIQPAVQGIPKEVIEAAQMDGAGPIRAMISVAVPLLRPSIATAGVMCSIFSWNEFFFALIFTNNKARTYPVFISSLITDDGPQWGTIAATSLLAMLPIILCCLFMQRYLVHGLSAGAVR
ncbi:carbohydrate ABC transporter permease [Glaciibacter superstes]|uniref:carbohydrate ABC transporter permease n=1 Tax=Glaciibacter superstes TaxID=501023 RepID=UPI0003B75C19|nr:carbohydrate ABC transporter permease [Glaciibacter superstes]